MVSLTGLQHKTIEQHVELGKSRIKRDATYLEKLCSWFHQHDPFDVNEHSLRCISTGLTASDDDCINFDRAEEIEKGIQLTLDGVNVAKSSSKRYYNRQTNCAYRSNDSFSTSNTHCTERTGHASLFFIRTYAYSNIFI